MPCSRKGRPVNCPMWAISKRDQSFTWPPGSSCPPTTAWARSAPAWTTPRAIAAGISGYNVDKSACTSIHRWPDNALKVVGKKQIPANQWTHVAVRYDGSGKASGVKVYLRRERQPVNVEADRSADTIRTEVPLKIGQRHTGQPLSGVILQDLRIYEASPQCRGDRRPSQIRSGRSHPGRAARTAHAVADPTTVRLVAGGGGSKLPESVIPAGSTAG